MTVVGQILLLCVCVAIVKTQPYFDTHRQHLNDESVMKNLNNIIHLNLELSNSILKDIELNNKALAGTLNLNDLGRSDIFDDIDFKRPGFYGSKIYKPDRLLQGDQGGTFKQGNENTVTIPFETNDQSQKIGDIYNGMDINVKKEEKNVMSELNQSGNTDEPTEIMAEPESHPQNSNIKVPSQLNDVNKLVKNSQTNLDKEIQLSKGRNNDEKHQTDFDSANEISQELQNLNGRNDDVSPEANVDTKFDSDAIIKAILMVDPEINDLENDPPLDKHKEPIVLSDTKNEINVDDRNLQADETQTSNIPNRFSDDNTQYLYVANTVPALTKSNNSPYLVSKPTFAETNNQPQTSDMQTFLPQTTKFQNTNYQPVNPNSQVPVNNILVNENNLPSNNVVMAYPNNGIQNGYTSSTIPANGNSGYNNQIPIYVTNRIPVSPVSQTANGGYLQVINSPRQYFMVQLGNGQTILVPANSGQTSVSNAGQVKVVPWNKVQANVQNKGQVQYVPVNRQNLVQVPANGQLSNPIQVIQLPSNGQAVYGVMEPNVPQMYATQLHTQIP